MNTRRTAFALAGILTATALTGALAIAGMSHRPAGSTSTRTPVVQLATAPPLRAPAWADD